MRTTLYTFLLAMALVLAPISISRAGTDDSGLQMFTVDFSKQLGEGSEVAQEDTLLSPYCYNMFFSGNGLCSFPRPKWAGDSEWSYSAYYYPIDCIDVTNLNGLAVRTNEGAGSTKVYYHAILGSLSISTRTQLTSTAFDNFSSDMFAYSYGTTNAVFLGNQILNVYYSSTTLMTSPVILKTATGTLDLSVNWCRSATIWQNRLFLASQSYIYFSAPQDFENFSNTATAGGTINMYDSSQIYKLIGTKYGLYIFTSAGIYLQSGGSTKNSWSIEKISELTAPTAQNITVFNDVIYFASWRDRGSKIYSLSGINLNVFAEIPYPTSNYVLTSKMQFIDGGRFLLLSSSTANGTAYLYDVSKKTLLRSSEYNGIGSNKNFVKNTGTGYKIYELPTGVRFSNEYDSTYLSYLTPLYPWAYQTAWFTLDGNASNRKEIDRVEFDYQGGTTAVYLYYAYGNGSLAASVITLTAPVNTRMSTYVWNAPIGRQQSNRFYLYFLSSGAQTMTTNYILKQARIYYRNIGNYKNNSLR